MENWWSYKKFTGNNFACRASSVEPPFLLAACPAWAQHTLVSKVVKKQVVFERKRTRAHYLPCSLLRIGLSEQLGCINRCKDARFFCKHVGAARLTARTRTMSERLQDVKSEKLTHRCSSLSAPSSTRVGKQTTTDVHFAAYSVNVHYL